MRAGMWDFLMLKEWCLFTHYRCNAFVHVLLGSGEYPLSHRYRAVTFERRYLTYGCKNGKLIGSKFASCLKPSDEQHTSQKSDEDNHGVRMHGTVYAQGYNRSLVTGFLQTECPRSVIEIQRWSKINLLYNS